MGELTVDYLLAKSVLRLTLSEYLTRSAITGRAVTTFEGTAALLEVADTAHPRAAHLPDWLSRADTTGSIVLRPDRRVSSIQATSTGRGPGLVKAAISVVGTLVGVAVAVANPPLGLGIAGAALTGGTHRGFVREEPGSTSETRELTAYRTAYPVESRSLVALRAESTRLGTAFADGLTQDAEVDLENLDRRQRLVARHLQPFEDHYAGWVRSQTTKTLAEVHEVTIDVDDLPTRDQLTKALAAQNHPPGGVGDSGLRWLKWAVLSEMAVSIDVEDVPAATGATRDWSSRRSADDDVLVEWRTAVPATITTWSVKWIPEDTRRDPAGVEETVAGHYQLVVTGITHRRIVRTATASSELRLPKGLFSSSKLAVSFNDMGEPSEIGVDQSSQLAETIAAAPGALKDSLGQGSSIAAAFVPGSASAARLAQALAVAKNRKELSPLLATPGDDAVAAATAKSSLADAVEMAELEARLQLAHAFQAEPDRAVLVHQFGQDR